MAAADRYEPLVQAFARITADGAPAALVARRGGEVVADLAAGTDRAGRRFTSTAPVFLYSAVKPVTALTVLLAAADGEVDLDAPVAAVWGAFGAHGKASITVAHALAHGAAVPGWREPLTLEDLADRPAAAAVLAASEPWWPPGEPGEHALSYGHLLDAILRAATGEDITRWWSRVSEATGITIDLQPGDGARSPVPLEDPGGVWLRTWERADDPAARILRNPPGLLDVETVNGPAVARLIAPAVTGYGSAHDLAGLWAWWPGSSAARRLGVGLHARACAPTLSGVDRVLGREVSWGLGPQFEPDGSFGMGGIGGCVGWYEPALELSVGFTTPQVGPPGRLDPLDDAIIALRRARR